MRPLLVLHGVLPMNHEFCYGVNVATTAAAYCRFVCTLGAGFIFIFLNFLYLVLNFTSTSSGIKGIKAYTFSCMLKANGL